MARGGRRPGAGRPKGKMESQTLEKLRVAETLKQRVLRNTDKLFVAQAQLAFGSMKVIRVDETEDKKGNVKREHVHVTDVNEIIALLNEHEGLPGQVDGTYYYFVDVLPDSRAIDSMLDRTFGKASQSIELTVDPRVNDLKAKIQARAAEKGVTYEQELALWGDKYSDNVAPEIRTKLLTEVVQ